MFWGNPVESALSNLKRSVNAPVRVVLWDGREVAFSDVPRVTLRLRDTRAASALVRPTLMSLAQAYIDGKVDLEGDIREAIRSAEAISRAGNKSIFDARGPTNARRSQREDRDAIEHHYDVSNDFYALWLDPRMVYSCAYFRTESDSLETAQLQKLDHICTKLMLRPGDDFLDIGCGWGALVMHAARHYGVRATGVTLSENQHRLANESIRAAGLENRCRVLLQDYRDIPGEEVYDKVASVGMFEHVGLKNLPVYSSRSRTSNACGRTTPGPSTAGAPASSSISRRRRTPRASAPRASGACTSRAAPTASSRAGCRSTRCSPRASHAPASPRFR